MIWLSWRLHRGAVFTFAAIFGSLAAAYLVDSFRLQHAFDAARLGNCLGVLRDGSCHARKSYFLAHELGPMSLLGLVLMVAVCALGVFLGAPLVSTEFERGTWQWVWAQRISRTRWLAVNYLLVAAIVTAIGAALGAAFTWWSRPLTALTGQFGWDGSFDNTPLMCAVFSLFGFSVGVTASALLRRNLAAMGATVVVFIVTRFVIAFLLRPYYMTPITGQWTATEFGRPLGLDQRDWNFDGSWVDSVGNELSSGDIDRILDPEFNPAAAGQEWYDVLRQYGIHYHDLTQPYERFGAFQLIEAGIFLGLIVLLAALAFWRIRRRTA